MGELTDTTQRSTMAVVLGARPGRLTLRIIDGPQGSQDFSLQRATVQIGRSPLADVVIQHPSISKVHFELRLVSTGVELRDRGSTNGCWISGCRVFHALLGPGSSFRAGDCHFCILEVADVQVTATVTAQCGYLQGRSVVMRELFASLDSISTTPLDVLILGETGTGKELTARTIHKLSPRHAGPFVTLDCGAIAPSLADGTLFGFCKGAFTGADHAQAGVFEAADGGVIFLDEIGELSAELQIKLLHVLERREVVRLGEPAKRRSVDVRVVAATHRDLRREVAEGRFREDLFYRLARGLIEVPPLRERGGDILELAELFLVRLRCEFGLEVSLSTAACEVLRQYQWPGNVRELKNCIERAAHTKRIAGELEPSDLRLGDFAAQGRAMVSLIDASGNYDDAHLALDRFLLARVLEDCRGNLSEAARRLGVSRPTLRSKLKSVQLYPTG
jgi:transcriptional regulator with PAS, ATPase and Fis domain